MFKFPGAQMVHVGQVAVQAWQQPYFWLQRMLNSSAIKTFTFMDIIIPFVVCDSLYALLPHKLGIVIEAVLGPVFMIKLIMG